MSIFLRIKKRKSNDFNEKKFKHNFERLKKGFIDLHSEDEIPISDSYPHQILKRDLNDSSLRSL